MKQYLLIAGFAISSLVANAQFAYNYLKAADDYYRKGDYYSAAQYYEKYLTGNKTSSQPQYNPYNAAGKPKDKAVKTVNREEVVYKAGESYQRLNNYVKAEPFFKDAVEFSSRFPLARYWYAKSLKANSKFEEAESEFNKFLSEYGTEDEFKSDASKELKNLQFRAEQLKKTDLSAYSINKMGLNKAATSAPALMNNTLVFSSTRQDNDAGSKSPYINKIYQGSFEGTDATKLDLKQGTGEHLEGASFSPDGSTLYVTKWSLKDNKKDVAIYMSTKKGDSWGDLVPLDNNINTPGYSSQQPYVTPDGSTLYYSSNKPGGSGGFDIWMAPLTDGQAGASTNLGSEINSAGDEYAPFYYTPSKSLIFSSNGRVGMGGFDFYIAKSGGEGIWGSPVNMGYPINSVKDDIYLLSTSNKYVTDTFYFSSDRGSECCLEIFAASKMRTKKRVIGVIVDCLTGKPMPDVTISIVDDLNGNATMPNKTTNHAGRYEILLDEYQPLKITAEKEGYLEKTVLIARMPQYDTLMNTQVCLEQPGKKPFEAEDKPVVIENIYFDYDSAVLKPESYPVLDSVVGLMERYPTMAIEVSGHTDNKGGPAYNKALSEARAKAFVDYVSGKGIDAARMTSKGYGEERPIAPNTNRNGKDNPAGRAKNRRTEIKVLHY